MRTERRLGATLVGTTLLLAVTSVSMVAADIDGDRVRSATLHDSLTAEIE